MNFVWATLLSLSIYYVVLTIYFIVLAIYFIVLAIYYIALTIYHNRLALMPLNFHVFWYNRCPIPNPAL